MKKIIAGVDEVGRGSLIGPVYAAAVILNKKINNIEYSFLINAIAPRCISSAISTILPSPAEKLSINLYIKNAVTKPIIPK